MSIKVALEHRTTYRFDRSIELGPHVIRLRPAPHTRTPIEAYSLRISPADHFLNWQQDPFGNYLARVVFPDKARELDITVGLVADLEVINPFDFFIEEYAETFPFTYPSALRADLEPYLAPVEDAPGLGLGPVLSAWLDRLPIGRPGPAGTGTPTVDFLVALNAAVYGDVAYSVRMQPGVQTPDETLTRAVGSCRDSAWLLVAALRHFGLAARFVSGYLVQLTSDSEPLEGPSGPREDFTDLHAWAEVYVPGAGWIGLDPTSALFAGEGHIPLAATPHPSHAAPISGATEPTEVEFGFSNTVTRFHEDPRVTKPYTPEQVAHLHDVGQEVDKMLTDLGLELTMGGEPTFVSIDDMTSPQWTVAADGPEKRALANDLAVRLFDDFAKGGLVQRSQGKWYPGEPLPRWQIGLIWRTDGQPLWTDPALLADPFDPDAGRADATEAAERIARLVTARFGLPDEALHPCYEDPLAALAAEVGKPEGPPPDPDPEAVDLETVSALDAAATEPAAWALPLTPAWWGNGWASPRWRFRRGRLVLLPGESPAGARMPLSSVSWVDPQFEGEEDYTRSGTELSGSRPEAVVVDPEETPSRTALVVQARDGIVHVFLPPLEKLEKFGELIGLLDEVVREVGVPVVFEGYGPPPDPRVKVLMVTPDPGVIEVNLHPTSSWTELSELTATLYETARQCRLGTETFGLDGRHSGTGGGNHITLGGPEPARSPLLQRPDLLVSMLTYWQHHPALSYLFSGRFIGPTSQAPRVDEGRPETLYELEIAFSEVERLADPADADADKDGTDKDWDHRPWAVDRALRHLLTDITGNTHRAEFCIDKLYSPDSSRGRLGLLELRGFEMPPHPDMALVQALLVRAILARSALDPYQAPLIRWGTRLHERFLLPHFVAGDLADVIADLRRHQIDIDPAWFDPYLEFRFPRIGISRVGELELELRAAIEPWHVLGEESSSGGTARYVDSSVERVQLTVSGFDTSRYAVTCNSQPVPLRSTGTPGEYVAGIRYKAWKPWSALHPTLKVDSPLVFDVVDLANRLSLGGATYHVVHPGGRSYEHPPVNAKEAEARRARRFEATGHTTGVIDVDALAERSAWRVRDLDDYPLTLDLRRRTPRHWGRG